MLNLQEIKWVKILILLIIDQIEGLGEENLLKIF
tara:strand:+ start:914 stop:1015 length:102 start_codon:yes stop_codon:yes gene_type:complete